MLRQVIFLSSALAIILIGLYFFGRNDRQLESDELPGRRVLAESEMPIHEESTATTELNHDPRQRTRFLEGYGSAGSKPIDDLSKLFDALEAFNYSIKIQGALPTGSNREIVAALKGKNPYEFVFISEDFPFLNEHGELLDRWGSPIFFHFVEASEVGIRSAGPDGVMWNEDDLIYGDYATEHR